MMKRQDFELLLPVGQKEMAEAAIHNGADAIYVGFPGFNARGRSYDFELAELKEIIELCHLYSVKVNLAFNIVIFETELAQVISAIKEVLPLQPDALIVQDLGLVRIIKEMCPDQVVHASTQMTITNDLAMSFVSDLGIRRYVLGRENSITEIKLIAERTDAELEVFVHGALCVSYSGQCFTSETLGGRSANRGQCAQSCRFSYDLIVDGEKKNLVDRQYLVSPKDLCGIAEIPALMDLGVKSFKVEGRLKSPEYVGQVASSYRKQIDSVLKKKSLTAAEVEAEKQKMEVEYSRGFFPGWLHGVNHQELVEGTYSSHRGLLIGEIISVKQNKARVRLKDSEIDLQNGDGVSWYLGKNKDGASIYAIHLLGDIAELEFSRQTQLSQQLEGLKLYCNHDRSQKKILDRNREDRDYQKRIPIKIQLKLALDQPMIARVSDDRFEFELSTTSTLQKAQKAALNKSLLLEEFQALSQTPFSLNSSDFELEGFDTAPYFLNHKEIKKLRQESIQKLIDLRKNHKVEFQQRTVVKDDPTQVMVLSETKDQEPSKSDIDNSAKLHVLLRKKSQVNDLVQAVTEGSLKKEKIERVTLDFEFGRDYQESLQKLKDRSITAGLATTRILKPQEYQNLKILHSLKPDFILVRNLGAIEYYQKVLPFSGELLGDFSLNVTNHVSFNYLIHKGLKRVCLSYDLNSDQAKGLIEKINPQQAEITIHQSMPSFHMEHCVFAAFLSKGKSYRDCGKPCEKHQVQLKDQFGNTHWIKPDQECRNTMYNASAQTALPYFSDFHRLGLNNYRFEALHENGAELIDKINTYTSFFEGKIDLETALKTLKAKEAFGLSARQLARTEEYRPTKKDHSFLTT